MERIKKIPVRQCACCKQKREKRELLRIVRDSSGKVFIDFSSKASGRGAYICDNPECLKKLRKGRILNKVFECAVPDEIYAAIEEEYLGKRKD